MAKQTGIGAVILATAVLGVIGLGPAGAADVGAEEYAAQCAACHGTGGRGDGALAARLDKPASDLTRIARANAGTFPFARVYDVIDGRDAIAAHVGSDMPAWGEVYVMQATGLTSGQGTQKDHDAFARDRIIALIGYVHGLQAK